jgi:hypothetical protein
LLARILDGGHVDAQTSCDAKTFFVRDDYLVRARRALTCDAMNPPGLLPMLTK